MPAFTYLNDSDYTKPLDDSEMQELLTELRDRTKTDWRIGECHYTIPRLFRKPVVRKYYQLYAHSCCSEFQVINPVREKEQDCFSVPSRSQIANYILGYLAGLDFKHRPTTGESKTDKEKK